MVSIGVHGHQAFGADHEVGDRYLSDVDEAPFAVLNRAPVQLAIARIHDRLNEPQQAMLRYARFIELWSDCDAHVRSLVDEPRNRLRELS